MSRLRLTVQTAVISLLLSFAASGEAGATAFTFTKITDTQGRFSNFASPSINNKGTVAFKAGLDEGGEGIFTSSGGPITTITTTRNFATTSSEPLGFSEPSINNSDTVAFTAARQTIETQVFVGLFTGKGGSLTTIANSSGSFRSFDTPSINNKGTVAFNGGQSGVGNGIFTGRGGSINTIANNRGRFAIFSSFSINDSGTVAFEASLDNTGSGIFTGRGDSITTIADTRGSFRYFVGASINRGGAVAFRAGLQDQTSERIVISSGGSFTTIAESNIVSGRPFVIFTGVPCINNAGTVAFEASLGAGNEGIFTGPDPVRDKVIASGDSLFGSTVTTVGFFQEGLNDAGQVTFVAQFANGSQAIIRANPDTGS